MFMNLEIPDALLCGYACVGVGHVCIFVPNVLGLKEKT